MFYSEAEAGFQTKDYYFVYTCILNYVIKTFH